MNYFFINLVFRIQSQENEYRNLRFQILELELQKNLMISEKEKNEIKIKEIDLENEKRRQEITKLTEELNNSKMFLLKKEEEHIMLQETQTKIVSDIFLICNLNL